jgi:hypothetical protein
VKIFKSIILGTVLALGLVALPQPTQALEILSKSFLTGSNVMNSGATLYTNVNSTTRDNIYMRSGVLYTNTAAFKAVTLQKNSDGSLATYYLTGSLLGTNAATTNNVSFVLRTKPLADGRVSTEATNAFNFAINMNGANPVVFCVPIPSATLGAAQRLQVDSILSTAATGAGNTVIERLELLGAQ